MRRIPKRPTASVLKAVMDLQAPDRGGSPHSGSCAKRLENGETETTQDETGCSPSHTTSDTSGQAKRDDLEGGDL